MPSSSCGKSLVQIPDPHSPKSNSVRGSKLPDLANSLRGSSGPAIVTKATRQRFTMGYKRKIGREADACKKPDAVGALLRREELYFFHLTT